MGSQSRINSDIEGVSRPELENRSRTTDPAGPPVWIPPQTVTNPTKKLMTSVNRARVAPYFSESQFRQVCELSGDGKVDRIREIGQVKRQRSAQRKGGNMVVRGAQYFFPQRAKPVSRSSGSSEWPCGNTGVFPKDAALASAFTPPLVTVLARVRLFRQRVFLPSQKDARLHTFVFRVQKQRGIII